MDLQINRHDLVMVGIYTSAVDAINQVKEILFDDLMELIGYIKYYW